LIAIKGLFKSYKANGPMSEKNMTRESAIIEVASLLEDDAVVVSTTGMASRELFEYRSSIDAGHERDFLTVGGMGHANQIALGIAISQPKRKIYCFDGDGAAIMHMGSMGIVGQSGCKNFTHIVFNNGAHGSVGGQPTIGLDINFCKIAAACGYVQADRVEALQEIRKIFNIHQHMCGPTFIEICVSAINKKDIGRPSSTPLENKLELINYLSINT
jgi:phosphonopyruvate decarboxylase